MKKMAQYLWSGHASIFAKACIVDLYNPCDFMRSAKRNESIMMIPGTYAEMHSDYD